MKVSTVAVRKWCMSCIEILVKEETSGNVVDVRRKSDTVMAMVLTL